MDEIYLSLGFKCPMFYYVLPNWISFLAGNLMKRDIWVSSELYNYDLIYIDKKN